tara:strand:+ start:1968 stop:2183 length:216 start_codon:yes stop_codon:yes gene_type:complete
VRRDIAGIHRAVQNHLHLLNDRHVDAGLGGKRQDGGNRRKTFGGLLHLLHHILEAVALAEKTAGCVVSAER